MRTETKIGVVAGFAVVVAASVYFWKSKSRDGDLIVALTPSVVQPTRVGGSAPPIGSAVGQPAVTPMKVAAAPAKPEVPKPITQAPVAPPTADQLATSPQIVAANPAPSGFVPLRTGPSDLLRRAANENAAPSVKPLSSPVVAGPVGPPAPVSSFSMNSATPKPVESSRLADSTASGTVKLPPAIAQPPESAVKPGSGSEWKSTQAQPAGEWPKYHTIAKGETLAAIARKTYGDARRVDLILAANPEIKNPRQIRAGAKLTLPSAPGAAKTEVAAAPVESKPVSLIARANATPEKKDETVVDTSVAGASAAKTYTVKQGDSLYSIAAETLGDGRRWPELMKQNKSIVGADGSKIRPGMILAIPGAEQSAQR